MEAKLYLVSCDDQKIYDKFIDNLRKKVVGIRGKDYDNIKFTMVNKLSNNSLSIYESKDLIVVNKVSEIINNHNKAILHKLINDITEADVKRLYIFVRVDNLKTMNILRRMYKRPNYKTVRIENTKELTKKEIVTYSKYRFDSKITYMDDKLLFKQSMGFIQKFIPTLKFIHNE